MWQAITTHIAAVTGLDLQHVTHRSLGGGCINQAYGLVCGDHRFFVKLNRPEILAMFEAEAIGLKQILATQTIRVPQPMCWGVSEGQGYQQSNAYLVLEWLDLGQGDDQSWWQMGQQLAALHRVTHSQGFGWNQNNTIGATAQINQWDQDWVTFFREQRLAFQFQLGKRNGGHFPQAQALLAALPKLLNHHPQPALVHGDLWGGNAGFTREREPVIFDPAPYFGDREVDLAMTHLFGGFPPEFYRGYEAAYPLPKGYAQRQALYNLYHILNHFNLFGGSYESQANRIIQHVLT